MCLTTFDEEKYRETLLEEGREEGREEGLEEGLEEGREKGRNEGIDMLFDVIIRLKNGQSAEDIIASGISKTVVEKALMIS